MGLMCSGRILQRVPALIETIKGSGLVIVSDSSDQEVVAETSSSAHARTESEMSVVSGAMGLASASPAYSWNTVADGVNGVLRGNGILRFNESIDM